MNCPYLNRPIRESPLQYFFPHFRVSLALDARFVLPVVLPLRRIAYNVLPDLVQFRFVPDHTLVIIALPEFRPRRSPQDVNLFRGSHFKTTYCHRDAHFSSFDPLGQFMNCPYLLARFENLPNRLIGTSLDNDNAVYVVRHDHEFIQ